MSRRRRASPDAPGGPLSDLLEEVAGEGHLQPRLKRAAGLFMAALSASHGHSGGLVSSTADKIDASRMPRLGPPPGGPAVTMLDGLLKELRHHERQLLKSLVTSGERHLGGLADYGRSRSAYATSRTARAFAVGRLTGLLETLAEKIDGPAG